MESLGEVLANRLPIHVWKLPCRTALHQYLATAQSLRRLSTL